MAQIELRFFDDTIETDKKRQLCDFLMKEVFTVHYPSLVEERTQDGKLVLAPGDISLVVPVLDTDLSQSDAQFEVEITEGSANWPQDASGEMLSHQEAKHQTQERAQKISTALTTICAEYSHNIFEVNGVATGWVSYKPKPGMID